jgi:hypothetical protein
MEQKERLKIKKASCNYDRAGAISSFRFHLVADPARTF